MNIQQLIYLASAAKCGSLSEAARENDVTVQAVSRSIDPETVVRGRNDLPGKYLTEPVYYADIPWLDTPSYVPRFIPPQSDYRPRELWNPVPERAKKRKPLVLFRNDAVSFKGKLVRFGGIGISNNAWTWLDMRNSQMEMTKGMPISRIEHPSQLVVVQEDVLGHCFLEMLEKEENRLSC